MRFLISVSAIGLAVFITFKIYSHENKSLKLKTKITKQKVLPNEIEKSRIKNDPKVFESKNKNGLPEQKEIAAEESDFLIKKALKVNFPRKTAIHDYIISEMYENFTEQTEFGGRVITEFANGQFTSEIWIKPDGETIRRKYDAGGNISVLSWQGPNKHKILAKYNTLLGELDLKTEYFTNGNIAVTRYENGQPIEKWVKPKDGNKKRVY